MDITMALLRLIHVICGVFWAGVAFFGVLSLGPTARASGPDGGKFMQRLAGPGKMTTFMGLAALLTNVSGLILYWRVSGFKAGWITSGYGLMMTIGSLAALGAYIIGLSVVGRSNMRIVALGKEMQSAGGPPSPQQMTEMGTLQQKQTKGGFAVAILLAISVIGMSIAQYVWF